MSNTPTTPTNRKVEVWAKDQYGRHEILYNNFLTVEEALLAARKYVHDKNRNNPLTFDEQKRNWNFVLCELGETDDVIYAGALIHAKNKMLVKTACFEPDGSNESILWKEEFLDDKLPQRFYLGKLPTEKPWYAETIRRQPVTSLKDPILTDKTILFLHKQ